MLTYFYHNRDTQWAQKMTEKGGHDLNKSEFLESDDWWWYVMDFKSPDN